MVDNISVTAGSGTTIATDDAGGIHYQKVKIVWGVPDTVTDVTTAAPLPTKLGDGTNSIAVKAASTAPVATDTALVVTVSPNSPGAIDATTSVNGATAAITTTTSTVVLAAPASGLRNYITNIVVSNLHATAGTDVLIQDGVGGTTLYVIPAAALYGGASVSFPVPLRQPTTATGLYAACLIAANVRVSASGYKAA